MKHVLMTALMGVLALSLNGCGPKKNDVQIAGAHAFATAQGQANGAVFLTIINPTQKALSITGASTDVAERAELHTMSMDGDVMKMRKVETFEVPAQGEITLAPMGDHIMLMGLKNPLSKDTSFALTLQSSVGDLTTEVIVVAPGMKHMKHGGATLPGMNRKPPETAPETAPDAPANPEPAVKP